ncbi:hypothetical protein QBC40DRAFT_192315 [Triangularia verruculosa]|uniref:Telomeric single stranded DNA binding POT1/Cdc13 domain-containing protein n=1 Tax=Triangularia verruculosa TaxID=2587418 RepID=A0AAN7B0U5_9PEZI|nr:hypothetical protein QBC40DRAFT_192315 [Triangularia verruculosa]
MAIAEDESVAALLATKVATPIAQLGPDLSDQPSRAVRGEVGITWPYNSVTETFAFLLAEPDVRLRRARGQIRLELHGLSAGILSKCGLGAGDELLFSLEGATWAKDTSPGGIPGSRVEWQLQFNEKLVLQIKSGETGQLRHLNIDHPEPEPEPESKPPATVTTEPRLTTPEPEEPPDHVPTIRKFFEIAENEYASPAFVKRARLSYGALFEDGFDPFEEDGGVKGKGRKRTRFGRDSGAWRYTSQSPSPEPESPAQDSIEEEITEETTPQPSPEKEKLDEGCQTVDTEMIDLVDEAVQTEPAPIKPAQTEPGQTVSTQTKPVQMESAMDLLSEAALAQAQQETRPSAVEEQTTLTDKHRKQQSSPVAQEQPALTMPELTPAISKDVLDKEPSHDEHAQPSITAAEKQSSPSAAAMNTDMPNLDTAQKPTVDTLSTSSLFGTPKTPGFSMFGTGPPARIDSPSSIADQVRFGFSHIPHNVPPADVQDQHYQDASGFEKNEAYPDSYLDNSHPGVHINNYFAAADTQDLATQQPPMMESFDNNQWTVATQSPHYNQAEGGHFGADALNEGTPMPSGDPVLHTTDVTLETLPEGFASYGQNQMTQFSNEELADQEAHGNSQGYGEADDSMSEDAVGVEDEEDQDEAQDEYAYGEPIEEGDYDQRNYDEPSDDDEGLSEQEEEIQQEIVDRYGDAQTYDEEDLEDLEGEDEQDYEGEYDEEEGDEYDGYDDPPAAGPTYTGRALPQSNPSEPVVISLLSDSEDDDEPMPEPRAPLAAKPNQTTSQSPEPNPEHVDPQLSQEAQESEDEFSGFEDEAHKSEDDASGFEDEDLEEEGDEELEEDGVAAPEEEEGEEDSDEDKELDEDEKSYGDVRKRGGEALQAREEVPQAEPKASQLKDEISASKDVANEAKEEDAPDVAGGRTQVVDFAVHQNDGADEQARAPVNASTSQEDSFVMSAPEDTDGASDSESELEIEPPVGIVAKPQDEDAGTEGSAAVATNSGDGEAKSEEPDSVASQPEDMESPVQQSDPIEESEADLQDIAVTQTGDEEGEDGMMDDDSSGVVDKDEASPGGYDQELEDYYDDMVLEQLEQELARNQAAASETVDDQMSIASRVEADEDEDMDVEDDQEKASTAEPMSVVDEVDDDDVDMIDAGTPHFESPMDAETPRAEVETSVVITEVIEEVVEETVVMEVTTESIPDDVAMEPQATEETLEEPRQQEEAGVVETVRLEPVNEAKEEVPVPVADEEKPTVVTLEPVSNQTRGGEAPASPPLTNSFASQKHMSFAQASHAAMQEKEFPPTPLQSMVQPEPEGGEATQKAGSPVLGTDAERSGIDGAEDVGSPDLSFNTRESDAEEVASASNAPGRKPAATRSSKRTRNKKRVTKSKNAPSGDTEDRITVHTPSAQEHMSPQPEMAASLSSSPDVSVKLAQQSLAARRSKRGQPQSQEQPVRISPRLARRRSGSFQSSNQDAEEEPRASFTMPSNQDLSVLLAKGALASPSKGDVSVNLARDALNSPSKTKSAPVPDGGSHESDASTATLKSDLTKRLRRDFPDCINLSSLRFHVEKFPVVVAVVTSQPTAPARAKGGPREYFMSFHITDPSIAPSSVAEVQLYRPHKESLPIVKIGDAILLQRLQVKSISKKGFGLRSGEDSSWAVFDEDEGAPQIKGTPVEDWEQYRDYMTTMRAWWRSLDGAAREKVEKADKKMREAK